MNFGSSTLMPLLARIVIAAAMLTSGWMNCFGDVEIRHQIADGLRAMDIEVHQPEEATQNSMPTGDEKAAKTEEVEKTSDADVHPDASTSEELQQTTRGVNRIVWLIHDRWPDLGGWGTFIAWSSAILQLVAGVLLLVGLFTRLAALCICVALGMAMYIVTINMHGMLSMNPFDWPHDSHRFLQLFAGLGLFTLSLGLLFSGAGGVSIDSRHAASSLSTKKQSTEK